MWLLYISVFYVPIVEHLFLAKIFIKSKNGIYYTEYSYSKYLRMIDQNKLDKSTKEKNYNGAWGIVNG